MTMYRGTKSIEQFYSQWNEENENEFCENDLNETLVHKILFALNV